MSRNLNNPTAPHRDYGATSSSANVPDVNFSSGFSPTEFMSLSEDIANNINAVNSSCKQLDKMLKVIGTPRDQPTMREKVHATHAKNNTRIEATSVDLQRLTALVQRGDKQQKLQLEKLTNDFRSVVQKYSIAQQRISSAMKQTYTRTYLAQLQDDQTESQRAELLQMQRQEEANLQFEQDMLIDREHQIKQIESNILDVNAIMRKITTIVQSQGESVERIETSIENVAADVELGREELAKASQHRQSYRRKILLLLVIAVIIGLIVTGIIVGKLNS